MDNVRQTVKHYIITNAGIDNIADDFDIFESGIVNSLFAIQLMTFLEKSFRIKITMDDLDMDNYKSIDSIEYFIKKKTEVK